MYILYMSTIFTTYLPSIPFSLTMKLLFVLVLVCLAAISAFDVTIDAPGMDNFSTQYICIYADVLGTSQLRLKGGAYAQTDGGHPPKKLSFYGLLGGTRTGVINTAFVYNKQLTTTGTHWVYLYDPNLDTNVDYLQIQVVASTYTGDCELQTDPPSGWQSNFPTA